MLEKVLFWGNVVSACLVVLCFLMITVSAIIFGYGDGITSDPDDPRREKGNVSYMEKEKYDIYRLVMGKIHLTGGFSVLITFALSGLRWYLKKKTTNLKAVNITKNNKENSRK